MVNCEIERRRMQIQKKTVSGIVLISLLIGVLFAFNTQQVRAIGTVYIRADGSVDPPTAPVQRNGDLYTLTDNINISSSNVYGIVIERSDITLDGAGYKLEGEFPDNGIFMSGRNWNVNNVTIKNMEIKGFGNGVVLCSSSNISILNNSITNNGMDGILLEYSSVHNSISGNNITANSRYGIGLYGMYGSSNYNTISENNIIANRDDGIYLERSSSYNSISGNNIAASYDNGIGLYDFSSYNSIIGNSIVDNNDGIVLYGSSDCNIVNRNNLTNNECAIYLCMSLNNSICHNNFIDNTYQINTETSLSNTWDDGYPSGGNYWSDYSDVDLYKGPGQNETGGDGIWDHAYVIKIDNSTDNVDRYPFTQPNGWISLPDIESGLVGYWKFDEGTGSTVYDSSGNDNNGTVYGATWVDGKIGKALSLDGIDDYVMIPDSSSLRVQSFTLQAWIYMTVRPYQAGHPGHPHVCIINKMHFYNSPAIAGYKLDFEYPTATDDTLVISIGDGTAQRFLVQYNSINDLTLNQWHQVVGTYNGSTAKLYIDGQLKASNQGSYTILHDNTPLCFSREISQPVYDGFNGIMDNIMIYNRSLSADDIMTLHGFAPPSITGVARAPNTPNYDEAVQVTATITDEKTVDEALLSYACGSAWNNVSMSGFGNAFNASIPAQQFGTLVQYRIYANDTDGNWAVTSVYSYTVGDSIAPSVVLSHIPNYPLPGQKIKVYANVTEPVNASGVKTPVFFSYRVNGDPWWNSTMIFNSGLGLYQATIPACEKHDLVEYFVKALDNAGNINTTVIRHYEVLRCDANHNGVVDVYDVYVIAQAWQLKMGELDYNPDADINEDGIIDNQDLALVSMQYGKDP
jgi:parallel beta-helix repeat protein